MASVCQEKTLAYAAIDIRAIDSTTGEAVHTISLQRRHQRHKHRATSSALQQQTCSLIWRRESDIRSP